MIDQFRQDISDNMNKLQEQTMMTKRRLIFILSASAFALLFFLFIVGVYRKDDSSVLESDIRSEPRQDWDQQQLEVRLTQLQTKLDQLESIVKNSDAAGFTRPVEVSEKLSSSASPDALSASEPATTQQLELAEPIAMTDKAIRQFIVTQDPHTQEDPLNSVVGFIAQEESVRQLPEKPKSVSKIAKASKAAKTHLAQNEKTLPKSSQPAAAANIRTHIVQKGETLSQISVRYFGTPNRWKAIYDANRERIGNINQLKVGTQLVIPQDKIS